MILKDIVSSIIDNTICVIIILLTASIPVSFMNALGTTAKSPCDTYGYYLPITFIMCNINRERE